MKTGTCYGTCRFHEMKRTAPFRAHIGQLNRLQLALSLMSRRVGVKNIVFFHVFQCQRTRTIFKGKVSSQASVRTDRSPPGPQRRHHVALLCQTPSHLVLIIRSFSLSHGVQLATRGKPAPSIPAVQHRQVRRTHIGCRCLRLDEFGDRRTRSRSSMTTG